MEQEYVSRIVTYDLAASNENSDKYYTDIARFADEVLAQAENLSGAFVPGFREYMQNVRHEDARFVEEYELEFLAIGVLWKVYSGDAMGLDFLPAHVLSNLSGLRQKNRLLKPGIDFIRGILSTLFLSPDLDDNPECLDLRLERFDQLINWLEATGEFRQEAKRLIAWREYLGILSADLAEECLASAILYACWFDIRSAEVLGEYTKGVESYLTTVRPGRYWREDVIFCGRRRIEYHLNMVGAEIMNRVFRKGFLEAKGKIVALPGCMRLHNDSRCKAHMTTGGLRCVECSKLCSVGFLNKAGKKTGFEVIIVPHESSISAQRENGFESLGSGVVGVACALNLLSGGWMLRDLGVEAQCVLLDYSGCRHWHDTGIMTELNNKKLLEILGIEPENGA